MTLVTGTAEDIGLTPDNSLWMFSSPLRESSDGEGLITPKWARRYPVEGVISIELDPGPAVINYRGIEYHVEVPESGPAKLKDLIAAEIAFPTGTPPQLVGNAVDAYLDVHPLGWENVKPSSGVAKSELATAVQTSLGRADTAYQAPAVVAAGITQEAARAVIGALDAAAAAAAIANPESALNDAVADVASSVLPTLANSVKVVDARSNPSIARGSFAGQVFWLVNVGGADPSNAITGDVVFPVATVALPWTPTYLPNKVAWYDAQGMGLSNGAAVSTWLDLSGNGNHLSQATAGFRPVYNTTKINGHPAVVADGVDDYLSGTVANPFTHPFTRYVVATADIDNASGSDFMVSGTSPGNTSVGAIFRTATEQYGLSRGASITGATAAAWTTGPKLFKAEFNGTNASLKVNGVEVLAGTIASGSLPVATIFQFARADLGSTSFFQGGIGFDLIATGVVSSDNDAKMFAYLNDRWTLGL